MYTYGIRVWLGIATDNSLSSQVCQIELSPHIYLHVLGIGHHLPTPFPLDTPSHQLLPPIPSRWLLTECGHELWLGWYTGHWQGLQISIKICQNCYIVYECVLFYTGIYTLYDSYNNIIIVMLCFTHVCLFCSDQNYILNRPSIFHNGSTVTNTCMYSKPAPLI